MSEQTRPPSEEQDPGRDAAYPIVPPLASDGQAAPGYYCQQYGLTKRERFAMAAMQGLLANEAWEQGHVPRQTAIEAVECADELLKELTK